MCAKFPSAKSRSAFTLVELLVVITIIGMLAALLLPAVNSARESGRQTQCTNNQRQYGLALQQYATSKDYFPGYRQLLTIQNGATPPLPKAVVSWQAVLLPNIGKSDVYEALQGGVMGNTTPLPYIELSICPSDSSGAGKSSPWTSYVVNTGRLDGVPSAPDGPAYGIFQDRALGNAKVTLTDIKDGQATTMMVSENIDAYYYLNQPVPSTTTPDVAFVNDEANANCWERGAGFVWWDTSTSANEVPPDTALPQGPPSEFAAINGKKGDGDPGLTTPQWPSGPYDPDPLTPSPGQNSNVFARPSSNHPGGVVATFAGGNTQFINEEIDYKIYCLLMTPQGAKTTTNAVRWQKYYPLDEGAF